MSIYETTIKNPKKIAEFYKQLSEQKDIEIKQLKEQLKTSEKARKEAIEYINKHAYFDEEMTSINALGIENTKKVLDILDIDKGEMKDE